VLLAAMSLALLAIPRPASAGYITLDFNEHATVQFNRGAESGFGWQNDVMPDEGLGHVQGHWDLSSACIDSGLCGQTPALPYDYDFTPYLGTDPTGCRRVDAAGTPLGPTSLAGRPLDAADHVPLCGTPLRLDRGGLPFDVRSFIPIAGGGIHSSKGGSAFGSSGYLVSVVGEAWTGVDWIVIEGCDCGTPAGIDDLTIEIPEPGVLALLGALAVFGGLGRMRKRPVRGAPGSP